jgi:hypothetical protein
MIMKDNRIIPDFFQPIKKEAKQRWDQLEADPDLAAPWHHLFRQVKDPRHVLSELFQNADDAEAEWAIADIHDEDFYFAHNGKDFNASNLQSLCRFGYSDKRFMHTIGFRGLGFKSLFSLGPKVELWTPTLAIVFFEKRFTEPVWIQNAPYKNITTIKVTIDSTEKKKWLEEDIASWSNSGIPLLFFKNLKSITLQNHQITKEIIGSGPVENSNWIKLSSAKSETILHIWSEGHEFPKEAIKEIRSERGEPDFELPPCQVDIIFGLKENNKLFVVLPTPVNLELPISCNAPFIQDPARHGIKDPINSPTNRWLLNLFGELEADTFISWLGNSELPNEERAKAYKIIPKSTFSGNSLTSDCSKIINNKFIEGIKNNPILLCHSGKLKNKEECLGIPSKLLDILDPEQILQLWGDEYTDVLSEHIPEKSRNMLRNWGWLNINPDKSIISRFQDSPYPSGYSYPQICELWIFLESLMNRDLNFHWNWEGTFKKLAIVPIKENDILYPANSVLQPVNPQKKQFSNEELKFLTNFITLIDTDWIAFLKSNSESFREDNEIKDENQHVLSILERIGLDSYTNAETLVKKVAESIFCQDDPGEYGVSLARIAARMDIPIVKCGDLKILCNDGKWRLPEEGILTDLDPELESLIPENIIKKRTMSSEYWSNLEEDDTRIIKTWIIKNIDFMPHFITPKEKKLWGLSRREFEDFCLQRGIQPEGKYRLKNGTFQITDYDFEDYIYDQWEIESARIPEIWSLLTKIIIQNWNTLNEKMLWCQTFEKGSSKTHEINMEQIPAAWVLKLRSKQCLLDSNNQLAMPVELIFLNTDTSAYQGIARFLHNDFIRQEAKIFLTNLGVGDQLIRIDPIINRLQALSQTNKPPLRELTKLYEMLENFIIRMTSDKVNDLKLLFTEQTLLFGQDNHWYTKNEIFQKNENDIPSIPTIKKELDFTSLWDKLEIKKNPSFDDLIDWINTITVGPLNDHTIQRLRNILEILGQKIWQDCDYWINVMDEWCRKDDLQWYASNLDDIDGLFRNFKEATADFSFFYTPPNNTHLSNIRNIISLKPTSIKKSDIPVTQPDWIITLANCLLKLDLRVLDDGLLDESITEKAKKLKNTQIQIVHELQITPYIEGQPAGDVREVYSLWNEDKLMIVDQNKNKYMEINNAITPQFPNSIQSAIETCIDRPSDWINDYFEANYKLAPEMIDADTSLNNKAGIKISEERKQNEEEISIDKQEQNIPSEDSGKPENIYQDYEYDEDDEFSEDIFMIDEIEKTKDPQIINKKTTQSKNETYFKELGFERKENGNLFRNQSGEHIRKSEGSLDWDYFDREGNLKYQYWISDSSLEKGAEIPSEIWEQFKNSKESIILLFPGKGGTLDAYNWENISLKMEANLIELFPATYRLLRIEK